MPYKFETDKLKIPRSKDRRVKLTWEQREEIKDLKGVYSQRVLADMYNCSKRTIAFIHDPDKLAANLERRKERGGSKIYYNKDEWRKTMQDFRKHKKALFDDNLLYNHDTRTI